MVGDKKMWPFREIICRGRNGISISCDDRGGGGRMFSGGKRKKVRGESFTVVGGSG